MCERQRRNSAKLTFHHLARKNEHCDSVGLSQNVTIIASEHQCCTPNYA